MAHGHGHGHGGEHDSEVSTHNKQIAILISVLALFLAIAETIGKSAQTAALTHNIEASDFWSFFQAKTIRKTMVETAAEQMELDIQLAKDPVVKELLGKRVQTWRARAAVYESEPKPTGGEGRKELRERAIHAQELSHEAMEKYHKLELASAGFQIAIVLASSYLITKVVFLLFASLGVGAIGILFMLVGVIAPKAHLFHIF